MERQENTTPWGVSIGLTALMTLSVTSVNRAPAGAPETSAPGVKRTADTDAQRERAAFLRDMFLPVQATVHFFYENHFGIIGVDETMGVDEMVIF